MNPPAARAGRPPLRIGVVLPSLRGGGAERVTLTLARALRRRGHQIDLVVLRCLVAYPDELPAGTRLFRPPLPANRAALRRCRERGVELAWQRANPRGGRDWRALARRGLGFPVTPKLALRAHMVANYLRAERPSVVLSALPPADAAALCAAELVPAPPPVVVAVHSAGFREGDWLPVSRALYPRAAGLVTVSGGVGREVEAALGPARPLVRIVHNPVPSERVRRLAAQPVAHPWFAAGQPPVVLAVGRDTPEKDWPTLVRAFATARARTPARLVILGELSARLRERLRDEARRGGAEAQLAVLGFDPNPYRYMRRAAVLALSSHREGLPTVLIEALACGTPVVSTDSPHGPDEILCAGRFGKLVPVAAPSALADAIVATLGGEHPPPETLRRRAADFCAEHAARGYEAAFAAALGRTPPSTSPPREETSRTPCAHGVGARGKS